MRPATARTHVANLLREKIRSGEYPPHSEFPTETQLAAQFGVARNTVRSAIDILVHEGLLEKSQGRRSTVAAPRPALRPAGGKLAWFSYLLPSTMESNQIYFELFQRMVNLAQEQGLTVQFINPALVANWNPEVWSTPEWNGIFSVGLATSQEGGSFVAQLQALPNLISIDENDGNPGAFTVATDNYFSARIATMQLLECGCREIVFLNIDGQTGRSFRERQNGFEAVMRETPGDHIMRLVTLSHSNSGYFQAHNAMEEFVQNRGKIDGVFCATDMIAIRLLEAALRYRVKVPEELKIIGFDGTYSGQHITPKLTTVSQPLDDIARTALQLALELHSGHRRAPCTIKLPGYLLRGETT